VSRTPSSASRSTPLAGRWAPALVAGLALCVLAPDPARAQSDLIEVALTAVDGERVSLNKGSRQGVAVGQIYDVYRDAQVYYLPLTRGEQPIVRQQERVGRVQVYSVEETRAEASPLPDGGRSPTFAAGERGVLNPTAVPPNRAPTFTAVPDPATSAWRETVNLRFGVTNEPDEPIVYTWSTTGGRLAHERTLDPYNTWTAPPESGSYQVTVEATDLSNQTARQQVVVRSTGVPPRSGVSRLSSVGTAFGGGSQYNRVRDVCFDNRLVTGRRYVLESVSGGLVGREPRVVVELPDRWFRLSGPERDFSALAVANPDGAIPAAFYAIDADNKTVIRYPFGGRWSGILAQEPAFLGSPEGGSGNGRFRNPTDLCVSLSGRVYVVDAEQRCVQAFNSAGQFLVSFGRPGTEGRELGRPVAVAVNADDVVYVLDDQRKVVVAYRDYVPVNEFRVGGEEDRLVGLAVDPFSGDIYVLEANQGHIKRYSENGRARTPHYTPQSGLLDLENPTRIRIDPLRVLWVVDREGGSVVRLDTDLNFLGRTGGVEFSGPLRVAGLPAGGAVALDRGNFTLTCFDRDGWITARFGGEGSEPGRFEDPVDVAVSRSGNISVLDAERVQIFNFSRSGSYLGAYGQAGEGPSQIYGVIDLSAANDRSLLVVAQQRPDNNFNLLNPSSGASQIRFGRDYTGDLTPTLGCVSGAANMEGDLVFWSADEDGEVVYRAQMRGSSPTAVNLEFEDVSDMEPAVTGQIVLVDEDLDQVILLYPNGNVALRYEDLSNPWDVGVDDYGRIYVYDSSTRRIHQLE
jgi:hypothetical protein